MARPPRLRFGANYHLYQRGNNNQDIYIEEGDYDHFLALYTQHIPPVAELYAYCLLPNHLHLLVRILTQEEQRAMLQGRRRPLSPSRQFAILFTAYGNLVNEVHGRSGTLFEPAFGRVGLSSSLHRDFLAAYIHRNPMKHGLETDFRQWPHSSYHAPQALCSLRDELFTWFPWPGGFESAHYHLWPVAPEQVARLAPDDFD